MVGGFLKGDFQVDDGIALEAFDVLGSGGSVFCAAATVRGVCIDHR